MFAMRTNLTKRVVSGHDAAYVDFCLLSENTPLMVSFYERSLLTVKAIGASFNAKSGVDIQLTGRTVKHAWSREPFDFFCSKVDGYDPFYHGIAITKELHKNYLVTSEGRESEDFYSFLMHNYDLPLMREWSGALWDWAKSSICRNETGLLYAGDGFSSDRVIPLPDGRKIPLTNLRVYHILVTPEMLEGMVSKLLREGTIRITDVPQQRLQFKSMDDYFNRYGGKIVQNLSEQMSPLIGYEGEVEGFTLKHKRLYPQQAAMVNGVTALLTGQGNKKERRRTRSKYAILCEGMGTGKVRRCDVRNNCDWNVA